MIRAAAFWWPSAIQSLPRETSHNPLMIATKATTVWLKQPTCFFQWENLEKPQNGVQCLLRCGHLIALDIDTHYHCYPAHACMKGLSNQFCLSVRLSICQSIFQSSEKFWNLNIDRVKRFQKTGSSIDIVKKVAYVYLTGSKVVLYPLLF